LSLPLIEILRASMFRDFAYEFDKPFNKPLSRVMRSHDFDVVGELESDVQNWCAAMPRW
jgi:hypothetical protein